MREQLTDLRIGVLMGGMSREREVSLRSGSRVLESLRRQGFDAVEIDVDPQVTERLREAKVTFAFIALHGRYGEDGAIQGLLEILGIPYTGSPVMASAIAMNKVATKRLFASAGVPTPAYVVIDVDRGVDEEVARVIETCGIPAVVKPVAEGSSIGVQIVDDPKELNQVVRRTLYEHGKVFVEQYIAGREVTVGILGTNGSARALPVLELRPKKRFYDYEAKYTEGMTEFICPAALSAVETAAVQQSALAAHRALGCRGMSRIDGIVTPDGGHFMIEVNTIPGLTAQSDLPAQARAAGMEFDELIFEILKGAYVDSHPRRTNGQAETAAGHSKAYGTA